MALWAVVPAAGCSRRMQGSGAKQYLVVQGQPVILHTLQRLRRLPALQGLVLVLNPHDTQWPALATDSFLSGDSTIRSCAGGQDRSRSVMNGLDSLAGEADEQDWVLVHDAARPCVRHSDMLKLLDAVAGHPAGGLLAVPVADTLKRADASTEVEATVARDGLWAAQTPQLFRFGMLRDALQRAHRDGITVTDEASAMEHAGHRPLLVAGSPDNIKITLPQDLRFADLILRAQRQETA